MQSLRFRGLPEAVRSNAFEAEFARQKTMRTEIQRVPFSPHEWSQTATLKLLKEILDNQSVTKKGAVKIEAARMA